MIKPFEFHAQASTKFISWHEICQLTHGTALPLLYHISISDSSPLVQFQLLHSKFHLCSVSTRALILSTYVKFINLFPEIKPQIQQILSSDSQSRNGSQELQQRAIEYLQLTTIATPDVLVSNVLLLKG